MTGYNHIDDFAVDLGDGCQEHAEQIKADFDRYSGGFNGRPFGRFSAMGSAEPYRFAAAILAVEALSVKVPPNAAAKLVNTEAEEFNKILGTEASEMAGLCGATQRSLAGPRGRLLVALVGGDGVLLRRPVRGPADRIGRRAPGWYRRTAVDRGRDWLGTLISSVGMRLDVPTCSQPDRVDRLSSRTSRIPRCMARQSSTRCGWTTSASCRGAGRETASQGQPSGQ